MPIPRLSNASGRSVNRLKSYSAARNARSASWSGFRHRREPNREGGD